MKDNETKREFIRLRAENWSFSKISEELDVDKKTLINWSQDFESEIASLHAFELEALFEEFRMLKRHRIESLGGLLRKMHDELKKRDFSEVETDKLLNLYLKTFGKLKDEITDLEFGTVQQEEEAGGAIDINQLIQMTDQRIRQISILESQSIQEEPDIAEAKKTQDETSDVDWTRFIKPQSGKNVEESE